MEQALSMKLIEGTHWMCSPETHSSVPGRGLYFGSLYGVCSITNSACIPNIVASRNGQASCQCGDGHGIVIESGPSKRPAEATNRYCVLCKKYKTSLPSSSYSLIMRASRK